MDREGLSVIMAAHNAEATVGAALESLLEQRCDVSFEVVVVDDASTDGTARAIRAILDDRVRLIELTHNVGRAAARNLAVKSARYGIVVIADADDLSLPDRLQWTWNQFERSNEIALASGQVIDLLPDGALARSELRFPVGASEVDGAFRKGVMGVAHPAASFRKNWFVALGGYDPQLRWCEDFDLMMRGWAPGTFIGGAEALIQYRRRSRVTQWAYWWENDRHHRAILARAASHEIETPWSEQLEAASGWRNRLMSFAMFLRYRAVLLVRMREMRSPKEGTQYTR
jgi:glycosyltransferase involved in cell wall biosynthesis